MMGDIFAFTIIIGAGIMFFIIVLIAMLKS